MSFIIFKSINSHFTHNINYIVTINSIRFDIVFKTYFSCTSITLYLKFFMIVIASLSLFKKKIFVYSLSKSKFENIDINDLKNRDNELSIAKKLTNFFSTSWFSIFDWIVKRNDKFFLTILKNVAITFILSIFFVVLMIFFDIDIVLCFLNRWSFLKFE